MSKELIVIEQPTELVNVAKELGIEISKAEQITAKYIPFLMKIREAEAAAEKKAAKAPDKTKLKEYVLSIKSDWQYDLKTMEASKVLADINIKLEAFKKWANDQIDTL